MTIEGFPHLHVRPPTGWLNDPNGIGHWDGRWHVCYQANPAAPVWGDICWGHASSPNLLTWDDEPVVLAPRPGHLDAAGVWSGVAVVQDGEPALVYTAASTGPHDAGLAVARRGPDGVFVQPDTCVVPPSSDPTVVDVRDPFLFTAAGRQYAIAGGGRADRSSPLVPLWAVDDLDHWHPLGLLVGDDDPATTALAPAELWECPQLVRLAGPDDAAAWVLLVSRWVAGRLVGCHAVVGELVPRGAGLQFVGGAAAALDEGPDFYAAQAVPAGDRVLMWAWAPEGSDRTADEVRAAGWAGTLTFPRELTLVGGRVHSAPARELVGLRASALPVTADSLATDEPAWEVVGRGAVTVGLIGPAGERVVWRAPAPADEVRAAGEVRPVGEVRDAGEVRVLVDGSVLEAFTDGAAATHRVYPRPGEVWSVRGVDLRAWRLRRPSLV